MRIRRCKALKLMIAVVITLLSVMTAFAQVNAGKAAGTGTASGENAGELTLYATSAVLMDGESGRILYGKEEHLPLPNASTTKIMTCILILENCGMDERVTISSHCASMPKVRLGAVRGETYDVKSLLYSLMLESHNDSAVALAEHLGKRSLPALSEKAEKEFTTNESLAAVNAFAALMNEKAEEIGCEDTYFITPNGLDATEEKRGDDGEVHIREHHVTAADLARIMAYCIVTSPQRQAFLDITGTPEYSFTANGRYFVLQNHNAFLNMMEGALTGKTGFTGRAGYCYVGALKRDERLFIVSLLACGWPDNRSYKWKDCRKLMEYGLANFQRKELPYVNEDDLPHVRVLKGRTEKIDGVALVSARILERQEEKGSLSHENAGGMLLRPLEAVEARICIPAVIAAPVMKGQRLGEIRYVLGEEIFMTETIVAGQSIAEIDLAWYLKGIVQSFLLK